MLLFIVVVVVIAVVVYYCYYLFIVIITIREHCSYGALYIYSGHTCCFLCRYRDEDWLWVPADDCNCKDTHSARSPRRPSAEALPDGMLKICKEAEKFWWICDDGRDAKDGDRSLYGTVCPQDVVRYEPMQCTGMYSHQRLIL